MPRGDRVKDRGLETCTGALRKKKPCGFVKVLSNTLGPTFEKRRQAGFLKDRVRRGHVLLPRPRTGTKPVQNVEEAGVPGEVSEHGGNLPQESP